jgi:predicted ATP-grasp superfamily ATP-dependent carboligase
MTIYVYEERSATVSAEHSTRGMDKEGWGMLTRLVGDLAHVEDVVPIVHESRDISSLAGKPWGISSGISFEELLKRSDPNGAWFLIAPETGGVLLARTQAVQQLGRRLLSPTSGVVEMGTDKLRFGDSTFACVVPTERSWLDAWWRQGVVAKPRDGAGSAHVVAAPPTAQGREDLEQYIASHPMDWVYQRWIRFKGCRPASVAFIGRGDRDAVMLPGADQQIETTPIEGTSLVRFQYVGGRVPSVGFASQAYQPVLPAGVFRSATIDRLGPFRGYVGFDFIDQPYGPLSLIELNPRLTTSYVGYSEWIRRASGRADALGRLLLEGEIPTLDLDTPAVMFRADGTIV